MNVYCKCPGCTSENRSKTNAKTRVEYAKKQGSSVRLQCANCGKVKAIHVNKIYAKKSKSIFILSIFIFLFGIGFGGYYLMQLISEMKTVIGIVAIASLFIVPSWVYSNLQKEDQLRVNSFNRTYVK
ncbi:MAG: hypothetical protein LAT51_07260 [Flavobacteriaceae bacterium]|nr:hypothetical protein [Flavobacteriaceae bacterium]